MNKNIKELIKQDIPIDKAFAQLYIGQNATNESVKALLKDLIFEYTLKERENLGRCSEQLEAAHFAYSKAENELADALSKSFNSLLGAGINDVCKEYLEELALSDVSGLRFLSQTCENAFISVLEEGTLVCERTHSLTNYLLISACKELSPKRILLSAKLILEQALELANLWQSYASELLHGCIGGIYEALELICERAIKELKSGCNEPQAKELLELEENFRLIIASLTNSDHSGQILREIYDNELSSISAKLSRALGRGKHVLGLKISGLISEDARRRGAELKLDAKEAAAKLLNKLRK